MDSCESFQQCARLGIDTAEGVDFPAARVADSQGWAGGVQWLSNVTGWGSWGPANGHGGLGHAAPSVNTSKENGKKWGRGGMWCSRKKGNRHSSGPCVP